MYLGAALDVGIDCVGEWIYSITTSMCVGGERKHLYLRAPVPAVEIHVIEQRHLLPKAFLTHKAKP